MSDPQALIDWNTPFDDDKVALLDQVINAMYYGQNQDRTMANNILNQFKSNPESWTLVDKILEKSKSPDTKFFALQILDEAVNTRWKILPEDQKIGIRSYIIQLVLRIADDENLTQQNQHLLTKLNSTLISIVKQEWTSSWKNFIPDICNSARESQSKCENALNILKLLSEEVFDFSKNTITAAQARELKDTMVNDFGAIFELCMYVLDQSVQNVNNIKPSLIRQCLKTLQAFLSWIPLGYIFETNLVELVINNFIAPANSRIEAIKCFTEIASLSLEELSQEEQRSFKEKICFFFCMFVQQISDITKNRNLFEEFQNVAGGKSQTGFENFSRQIALAITAVMKNNIDLIEEMTNTMEPNQNILFLQQCVQKSLEWVCQLTRIPEDELFKICLDFWNFFCYNIMVKTKGNQYFQNVQGVSFQTLLNSSYMHAQVYPQVLAEVREIMIDVMAKPKEVLVVIDENGEAVEEHFDDTETINIYETMRETLIYLTNIDTPAMDQVIQNRINKITGDKSYFTFDRLNKLCWALGSISGCMNIEDENKFVVSVIKELLNLCEKTQGKSNKALVAADIMYVVGEFPRFLCTHWAFLKTVIKKLNEFMDEKHPGVQDMASETFLKISKLTKHMFVMTHDNEEEPYVNELIRQIPKNCEKLEQHQKLQVYEGIGHMIYMEQNQEKQEILVKNVMQYVDKDWRYILQLANQNVEQLTLPEIIKQIDYIIKVNQRIAESVGFMYLSYLRDFFQDLIKVYGLYSQCISNSVKSRQNEHMIKPMKAVRRDILRLIQVFIQKTTDFTIFNQEFLPTLKTLIDDYQQNDPNARDSEVLNLFGTMFKQMGELLSGFLQQILYNLCETTLQMIQNDYVSFPEFREAFFNLVENIVKHCTQGLFQLESSRFQTIILTILFAMKHEKPEIMEIGLETLYSFNQLVMQEPSVRSIFYRNFFVIIVKDTLAVMTDYRHVSGFKFQGMILAQMLQVISGGLVQEPIQDEQGNPHQYPSNKDYAQSFLIDSIQNLFPNLNKVQIEAFVLNLFNHCSEWQQFKTNLRDLLISMKSFSSQNDEFYLEEKKAAEKEAEEKEKQRRSAIPGLVKPSETQNGQYIDQQTGYQ